jgi:hypothetical protein
MPVLKQNPLVIPASAEKVFDSWWVENISLDASLQESLEPILVVDYRLCYYEQDDTSPIGMKPVFHPTERRRLHVRDLFTQIVNDPIANGAVWGAVEALGSMGKNMSILD